MSASARILLVEDDFLIRETLSAVLVQDGFEVTSAANGLEAVARLEQAAPDLVLSDIRMPEMNGFDLLAKLRSHPSWSTIPIVFLTALAAQSDIRKGMALGADDYIPKPFDPADVCRDLRTRLAKAQQVRDAVERQEKHLTRYLPHELRTPLNGILGFADLMVETAVEGRGLSREETAEYGQLIAESGQRLLAVAENLMLLRELGSDAGSRFPFLLKPGSPDWQRDVRTESEKVARRFGRTADMLYDLDSEPLPFPGKLLARVFAQLVDNACKFSLPGTPITVSGRREADHYRLVVSDRGRGMTPEQIASATTFRQFDREKFEQQGLGLGLEIARRFSRLAGGLMLLGPGPGPGGTEAGFAFESGV
jgi:two-component system sensor histidine kinase/response regulator